MLGSVSHVLLESAKPLFGDALGRGVSAELDEFDGRGIRSALLFHGSDLRDPALHRSRERHSPYAEGLWNLTNALTERSRRARDLIERTAVPVFVSTPDLLVDAPTATWLPVVVAPDVWRSDVPPLSQHRRPVVAHIPSSAVVKGTDLIEPTLRRLQSEGLIDYLRLEGLSSDSMPTAYLSADIVLDQFRLGSYGVAACEAMAAGRVVVSHVSPEVRAIVNNASGLELPIIEADADGLEGVLRAIVGDPESAAAAARQGVYFVRTLHDGAASAAVLSSFLEQVR